MSSSVSSHSKSNALEIIKSYRVAELQALLDYANLSRQGQKRDLLQRCKSLITSNFTLQLSNKIQQINNTRLRPSKSSNVSSTSTSSSSSSSSRQHPIVLPQTPPLEVLSAPNQIQFINLPFYDKMRTIECANMPVDWHTFSPLRFTLNETDIDLIRKTVAKVFLRIAPTTMHERHNDVLPPYLFVQCNNQPVISNNVSKAMGAQAHSIAFPSDITDKLIFKANASNTLDFLWLQSPNLMSLKNLPRSYTLSIQLVHCVSLDTLFDTIGKREPYANKSDNNDSDIEVEDLGLMATRHRVSLICPITQSLMVVPSKSAYCSHLTCFDLKAFLQMNERRLQWTCPLCKKSAAFESLRIDQRLQEIISKVPAHCSTVEIDSSTKLSTDCQYILDCVKQEKVEFHETTDLHGHADADSRQTSLNKSRHASDESDCIVLSSGSESESESELGEDDEDEGEIDNEPSIDNLPSPKPSQSHRTDAHPSRPTKSKTSRLSTSSHSTPSPIISTADDGNYWEDIAQMTYDLSPDGNDKASRRKRTSSSSSSALSSTSSSSARTRSTGDRYSTKRKKRSTSIPSPIDDIEIITLSSSDSSDHDDQLF